MFRMGQWKCDREVKFDYREERKGSTMKIMHTAHSTHKSFTHKYKYKYKHMGAGNVWKSCSGAGDCQPDPKHIK